MKPLLIASLITWCFNTPPVHQAAPVTPAPVVTVLPMLKPLQQPDLQPQEHLALLPPPALPVAPPGTYTNNYDFGNCTAYVASRVNVPNSWGDANTWGERAAADGIPVSSVPRIGAIAERTTGQYGHVAVVVGIGDGTVTVDEMNVQGLNVTDEATYPVSAFQNYIYK